MKIFILEGNFVESQFYKKVKIFEDETYTLLGLCIEEKLALEWTFDFGRMTTTARFNIRWKV